MVGVSQGINGQGLDLSNIEETTQEEINAYLTSRWRGRGPLYDQYAMSLMLDYAPDFAKLHWWAAEVFRSLPSDPDTYDPALAPPIRSSSYTATWSLAGRPASATNSASCAGWALRAHR